ANRYRHTTIRRGPCRPRHRPPSGERATTTSGSPASSSGTVADEERQRAQAMGQQLLGQLASGTGQELPSHERRLLVEEKGPGGDGHLVVVRVAPLAEVLGTPGAGPWLNPLDGGGTLRLERIIEVVFVVAGQAPFHEPRHPGPNRQLGDDGIALAQQIN